MAGRAIKASLGVLSLAVIVVGTYWMAGLLNPPASGGVAKASPGLNQRSVELATYILIEDLEAGQRRDDNLTGRMPSPILMAWIQIDRSMAARDYEAAYDRNEIAADNELKGKTILLSGTINSIDKDVTDSGSLTLRGSGLLALHAELDQDAMGEAASFRRGQQISLVCRGSGRVVTVATLENCQPLHEY